jgi:NAD(P)-dependent dehydrogenase (short-subunit alcohol dehydrogenase family)
VSQNNDQSAVGHNLAGKRALVTGGTSGIGRAAAKLLAVAGCRIAINYGSDDKKAADTIQELDGFDVVALKADVADPDAAKQLIADAAEKLGGLDVLVHSAGVAKGDDTVPAAFDRVVRTHLHSTHHLLPPAAEAMRQVGGGSIVLVTSIANNKGYATSYAAAMAGKRCYAVGFARQVAPDNIRVNCVAAGTIFTEMLAPYFATDADRRARTEQDMPLWKSRTGFPVGDDAAKAIVFLAGDLASHITGEELKANGGQWISV